MATSVKLPDEIVSKAKANAKALSHSLAEQIEHWAKIGKLAEENPDSTYEFINQG